jgi:hypothetical protein
MDRTPASAASSAVGGFRSGSARGRSALRGDPLLPRGKAHCGSRHPHPAASRGRGGSCQKTPRPRSRNAVGLNCERRRTGEVFIFNMTKLRHPTTEPRLESAPKTCQADSRLSERMTQPGATGMQTAEPRAHERETRRASRVRRMIAPGPARGRARGPSHPITDVFIRPCSR